MTSDAIKPDTDLGALAAAVHLDTYPDHDIPCSCAWWAHDLEQARRELTILAKIGWHVAPDISLPETAPSRRGGAETSRLAAESIDNLTDRQWAAWYVLGFYGPMTDEVLAERYSALADGSTSDMPWKPLPKQTPQSIRSRRAELVKAGHVHPTGEKRPTKNGGTAQVWQAHSEAAVAAA